MFSKYCLPYCNKNLVTNKMSIIIISFIPFCCFSIFISITPLELGLNILLLALILTWNYANLLSSWYAFLIFLIYVGGILVIFAYFVALVPNQQQSWKLKYSLLFIPIRTTNFQVSYLYVSHTTPILFLLIVALLTCMIIVVKITLRTKGPLRPFLGAR